jgi:hypothetical protein
LQPGRYADEAWIGEQCLTGDGRYVVAVIALERAEHALSIARGGLAYVVDAHTGAVRPLASGLALTYFTAGCGLGSTAALTRYLDAGESQTEVLAVDLVSGLLPGRDVTIRADTDTVMQLSNLSIGLAGMPNYLDGVGRGIVLRMLTRRQRIEGIVGNLTTFNQVTRLFSVVTQRRSAVTRAEQTGC